MDAARLRGAQAATSSTQGVGQLEAWAQLSDFLCMAGMDPETSWHAAAGGEEFAGDMAARAACCLAEMVILCEGEP